MATDRQLPPQEVTSKKRALSTTSSSPPSRRQRLQPSAMAPPLHSDGGVVADQSVVSSSSQARHAPSLADITEEQRRKYLRSIFIKRPEPLQTIDLPDLCKDQAEFAEEILDSYLRWTTFTARVWMNYDASCEKLFADNRVDDCGKLVLTPKALSSVKNLDTKGIVLNRVRFEVGTPFMTLCRVDVHAIPRYSGLELKAHYAPTHRDHYTEVAEYVVSLCHYIESSFTPAGENGFQIADIEELASYFRIRPTREDAEEKDRYPDHSPWMFLKNAEEETNRGWVDFEALDKSCSGSCQGCKRS